MALIVCAGYASSSRISDRATVMIFVCLLTAVVALAVPSAAATDLGMIEGYLRGEMKLNQIPGLSVAIVKGGQVLWTGAYGVRSLATQQPMLVETPVELASVSKSFTALSVLRLQVESRISLEEPITTYLPEFRIGDGRASAKITVRHLLEHRSGLSRRDDYLIPCCGRAGESDLSVAVRSLRSARLRRTPGGGFLYANSNYVLLAALVERVSRKPFRDFLQVQIFGPLGMTRTTLDRNQALSWGLADPHERRWGRARISDSRFSGWPGASHVKSTANDMGRYLAAILGGPPDNLAPEFGQFAPAQCAPYCMGWFHRPGADWLNKEPVFDHGGDIWGGNTAAILAPQSGIGVAVLLNAGVSRAADIARGVLMLTAGLQVPEPATTPWARTPDNWAISFAVAAVLMLAALVMYVRSAWLQLRTGERRFVWKDQLWQAARAVLLAALAVYLVYLLLGGSRPPVTALPTSLKFGICSLGGVTAAVLLVTAILGMAPKRGSTFS